MLLQVLAPSRVLARERLDVARQLGIEEVDERPRDELRDAAAAALLHLAVLDDRPLVVRLDVADARLRQQRPQRAVQEPGMPVPDVRVGPGDQVAGRLVEALPERLALAPIGAVAWQHLGVADHACALGLRDLAGVVVGVGVDDQQLVDERQLLHQLDPRGTHDRPDGLGFVEGRQHGGDGQPLLLLELHQAPQVRELGVMEARSRRTSDRPARARCDRWTQLARPPPGSRPARHAARTWTGWVPRGCARR